MKDFFFKLFASFTRILSEHYDEEERREYTQKNDSMKDAKSAKAVILSTLTLLRLVMLQDSWVRF